ncbi:FAD-dependent oxidoreductase [Salinimicrobium sediminilitoris]|uniref:FAD-dependent oxidoreductase n=1 Tax=Salinimicrobium sediminilitoris TaxID=2876715 RepID=UPI001E4E47FB|nr:FAD-dependent oxidoreductase [Salinimicrobium sediminilitoris]MCC8358325.1 FAD-dependent oxidoreductase [Salinimicrobium sediminilitoris]
MEKQKIVIVGGVAGGATAAARLRRLNENSYIVLLERGEHISFANCGLPYYIGGSIEKREKLLVQTVEGMSRRFRLDIRNLSEVLSIDRVAKTIRIRDLRTGKEYEEVYDVLLLSPGAKPFLPPIKGIAEAKNLFSLRNIPDTDKLKAYVEDFGPKSAVIIGGGFIGLEMTENLHDLGITVRLIEVSEQVMEALDFEMAAILQDHLRKKGVELFLKNGLERIEAEGQKVVLQNGEELYTDMIIMAAGVQPESKLAVEAGLELGNRKSIRVNEYLQTSDPFIYAVGDAIEVKDYISGQNCFVPLAWPANRQGRIVADTISGKPTAYKGTLGTAIAKVFDLTAATTGNNEKVLRRQGVAYEVAHIHPNSHAGYYPGAAPLALKLIFSPEDGKILGAQAVGARGADKRIDVLATAIKGDLTIYDLPELELAYAPPFSSAKDPVNMLGYVAQNMQDGSLETFQWYEVEKLQESGAFILDVRENKEWEAGHIEGAVHFPLDELRDRLQEFPTSETIYLYCHAGLRGYLATRILQENGFTVKNLDGGNKTYQVAVTEQSLLKNVVPMAF